MAAKRTKIHRNGGEKSLNYYLPEKIEKFSPAKKQVRMTSYGLKHVRNRFLQGKVDSFKLVCF